MDDKLKGKIILLEDAPEGKRGMIRGEDKNIYRFYQSNLKKIDTSQLKVGSLIEFTYTQKQNQKFYVQSMEVFDPFSLEKKEKLVSLLKETYPDRTEYQSFEIQKILESSFLLFYKELGYSKFKKFLIEKFSDFFIFEEKIMNGGNQFVAQIRPFEEWPKKEELTQETNYPSSQEPVSSSDNVEKEPEVAKENYLELLKKYEQEGNYEAYLNTFSTYEISPTMLSISWIEKTVRICQKLLGEEEEATFNPFDKLLIQSKMSNELVIQKQDTQMIAFALEHCRFLYDESEFRKNYNRTFFKPNFTLNDRWEALAKRFTLAEHKYYIYFYIIALYAYRKVKVLNEYLNYVENSGNYEYVETFFRLAKEILDTEENHEEFFRKYIRFIGISLDDDQWEYVEKTYPIVKREDNWIIQEIIDTFHQEEISNDFLVNLLDERISLAIGEKCINYYLYKKYDGSYSEKDLDLFGEILYHYPSANLNEVIFNNSYPSYNEEVKRNLLLNSWRFLVDHLDQNPKYYLVLCYIVNLFPTRDSLAFELTGISKNFFESKMQLVENDIHRFQEIYLLF